MRTIRHITVAANTNLQRARGGVIVVWNDSNTIELTMTIRECKQLERDYFIDIEDVIPDDMMGNILHHFRDGGMLLDEEGIRI